MTCPQGLVKHPRQWPALLHCLLALVPTEKKKYVGHPGGPFSYSLLTGAVFLTYELDLPCPSKLHLVVA